DVHLAVDVAKSGTRVVDSPQVTSTLNTSSRKSLSVEIKTLVGERLRQQARGTLDRVERQIILPNVQRLIADECRNALDRTRMPDHDHRHFSDAGRFEVGVPIKPRRLRCEIRGLPRVVR